MSIYKRYLDLHDRRSKKVRDERFYGTLGRRNSDGTVTIEGSRQGWVIVTLPGGTTTELPNTGNGHVPLRANLPVKMIRLATGDLVLDGVDDRLLEGDTGGPGAYGVMPHPFTSHTDVPTSYSGDAGKVVKVNATENGLEFATEAGAAVVSVNGQTGVVLLDSDDVPEGATNLYMTAAEVSKLAGIEALADVTDAGNVGSSIHGSTLDTGPLDADEVPGLNSASSFALIRWTWTTIKAFLKTYFDTLYAAVANGVTNGNAHDHNGGDGGTIAYSSLSGTPTIPTLPVKATGAEIDTGTDDAKFATSKAIEDSSYIKAAYADAKVADSLADGVTTIAPSQNAVFDALALKQTLDATLTSIAALGTASDKMLYTTGVDTWAETPLTATARSLLDDTSINAMRTTLGLAIGSDVQQYDPELAALAGLTSAADTGLYFTGAGTAGTFSLTSFGRSLLAAAAAVNARSTLGLIIGTDVQAHDAELAAIAGLTSAADKLPYFTGLGTAALATFTAFGRTLAALADAAAGIAALGLDAIYGRLAAANTWIANNAFNSTATSGSAVSVTRNLTATSTDAPVVAISQSHASDDQDALRVSQYGSADIISGYAGTVRAFGVTAGGLFVANGTAKATPGLVAAGTFQMSDLTDPFQLLLYMNGSATPASRWMGLQVVEQNQAYRELLLQPYGSKMGVGLSAAPGASVLGIKAGASSNDAAVGGVLYVDSGTHANTTSGETDLATYTVPADTLAVNNQELNFEAYFVTATANAKTIKVKFGSDSYTLVNAEVSSGNVYIRGRIIRTGAATQDVFVRMDANYVTAPTITISTATRTLSGSNILKVTGQGTATNDIKQEYFKVWYEDANV